MAKLPTQTIESLQQLIEKACADKEKGIPGAAVVVVGKDGTELFAHAAGTRGSGTSEPMTVDNVFWIASCTKMITGIACMQLVEQGKLALDDPAQIESFCPELRDVKVLQDDQTLVEKKRGITLRMLLTHTAGFGYTFFNAKLNGHNLPVGWDEFSGHFSDMWQPLVNQPGETWEYGINVDWAGILLERVTGQSLNDYFHEHIFQPLNLKDISMIPSKSMKERLAHMNQRSPEGHVSVRHHLLHRPLVAATEDEINGCFNSGGGGCFATPHDYCQILATLLNGGTSPTTGNRLLRPETVDEMFRNQIPDKPDFGTRSIPTSRPDLTNPVPMLYPPPPEGSHGWGLTFMLSGGITGRSSGTAHWAGLPNLWWWCDREQGVAGMICTQVLPFGDRQVLELWTNVETHVYSGLTTTINSRISAL